MAWSNEVARWLAAATLSLTWASGASGQVHERAAELYEQGIHSLEAGRYEEAAEQFAQAYAERPAYPVLYNLGQAYLAASRPVEGVDALRRYLEEGGADLSRERVREVERALAIHARRIAHVTFALEPADAELAVDGRDVDAPRSSAVPIGNGTHGVVVRKAGYQTHSSALRLRGGERMTVSVRLEPAPAPAAALLVSCGIPDVRVSIDGEFVASTPLHAPLVVHAGRRRLRFERAGYEPREGVWELRADSGQRIDCGLEGLDPSAPAPRGSLAVTSNAPHVRVWVDGRAYDGSPLPSGAHQLRVEAIGYRPFAAPVTVPGRGERTLSLRLEPLAAYRAEVERTREREAAAATSHRYLALAIGGTGLALGATALALAVGAEGSHADWERTQSALQAETDVERRRSLRDRSDQLVTRVNRLERWAAGLGAAGGVLALGGLALWMFSPPGEDSTPAFGMQLEQEGASLGIRGMF